MSDDFSPKPNKYILNYLYISPTGDPQEIHGRLVEPIGERLQFQYYKTEGDFQPQGEHAILNDFNIDIIHHWYEGVEEPYTQEISSRYIIKQRQTIYLTTPDRTVFIKYLEDNDFPQFNLGNVFISTPRINFNGDIADPDHADFIEQRVNQYVEGVPLKQTFGNLLNVLKQLRYRGPTNKAQSALMLASKPAGRMMQFLGHGEKKTKKRYRRKNKSRRRKHKSHRRKH